MLKKLSINRAASQITLGAKIATITIAAIALFRQDLTIIFSDALQSETTSHLIVIPILFAYLIYRKRKMLRAVIPIENKKEPKEIRHISIVCGVLLSITAILLYWHGSYTFTPLEYHMLAMPIFVAGLTLILFNSQTLRQLAFPIAFLFLLTPPPAEILYALGSTLSTVSSEASNALANVFGISSAMTREYGNPTITITGPDGTPIKFTVDIACSGIYSLLGFLIFAVFIAYIIRDKTWKKLALIVTGIPLIYALNIVRITTILVLGYHYGKEIALYIFHLLGGWILIFLGTLLLLTISEKILKTQIFKNPETNCPQCNLKPQTKESFCAACGRILKPQEIKINKLDFVKIAVIALTVTLLTAIQAPVFAITQTSPIVIINTPSGQQASTSILPQISGYTLYFAFRDTEFEQIAKQDMALIYLYSPSSESEEVVFVTIEVASAHSFLYRWETCLVTWPLSQGHQPTATQIELKDIKITENPPITARYFAFLHANTSEIQAVLYWFETAIFTVNQTSQQKHVKISVIAYTDSIEYLPNIEKKLITIAKAIADYWQPIKTWSQITMIISQNGAILATTTTIILTAVSFSYFSETKKQKKANASAYKKLSEPNKQIINAILETQKGFLSTLKNIAITHQKITGKPIDNEQLLRKLAELGETGIIESKILHKGDEPVQTWKANITF